MNSREEKHLPGAVGCAWIHAAPSSEAEWVLGSRDASKSDFATFEAESENRAWSLFGLLIRAETVGNGIAALKLISDLSLFWSDVPRNFSICRGKPTDNQM